MLGQVSKEEALLIAVAVMRVQNAAVTHDCDEVRFAEWDNELFVAGKTTLQSQQIRQLQMQKRPGQVQIQGQQKVTGNDMLSLVEMWRLKHRVVLVSK